MILHVAKSPLPLRNKKRVEEKALANCRKQISKAGQKMVTTRCQPEMCVRISKGMLLKVREGRVRRQWLGLLEKTVMLGGSMIASTKWSCFSETNVMYE